MKESETQKAIIQYLTLKRIFHWRNNTGATKTERGGFIRYGFPGSPDIICVINGQFVGIEVKAKGEKQNENQVLFQKSLEEAGGKYILAYSLDDVINNL